MNPEEAVKEYAVLLGYRNGASELLVYHGRSVTEVTISVALNSRFAPDLVAIGVKLKDAA